MTAPSRFAAMQVVEESILDDLHALGEPSLRYSYLIECSRALPAMPPEFRTDESIVRECDVGTWFAVEERADGTRRLHADSESTIVRGALALVDEVLEAGCSRDWAAYEWRLLDDPAFARNFSRRQLDGLRTALGRL